MGRKKKIIEENIVYECGNLKLTYEPSKYQKDIFEHIKHGNGNLVIEASAGSGKTTTLVNLIKLIDDDKRVLFCAFNKDIVNELTKKVKGIPNVDVKTIHGLGNSIILRNLGEKYIPIDENKYKTHIINNIKKYTSIDLNLLNKNLYVKYIANINKLVDFSRYNLAQTENDIFKLVEHHSIDLLADEIDITLQILEWGKNEIETIDYTDMVWLPNVLYMKPLGLQFDYIFADESQDFSIAQKEIILKCQKMGTRFVFCGDENQCLYAFASASPESFRSLKNMPNTTSLPLSVSYRCPKQIVKLSQTIVPTIEYADNAIDGEIIYNAKLEDVNDGDMILCRNNAPLMQIYADLIKMGKKCYIRGKEIGSELKRTVKNTHKEFLNVNLDSDGVFSTLYSSLFKERDKIIKRTNLDKQTVMNMSVISNKLDIINTLDVLSDGINTSEELIKRIDSIFSDKKQVGIALSTIHKAKGLESENVFIACRSLMPSKSAELEWEKIQEQNLIYVAYTRSKNKLCFLDEQGFDKFTNVNYISSKLKNIENSINSIDTHHKINYDFKGINNGFNKPKIGIGVNLSDNKPKKRLENNRQTFGLNLNNRQTKRILK